jgi:hypothetical protein
LNHTAIKELLAKKPIPPT